MKIIVMFWAIFLFMLSCNFNQGKDTTAKEKNFENKKIENNKKNKIKKTPSENKTEELQIYTGDWETIKKKGILRILALKKLEEEGIPKKISLIKQEFNYLIDFAQKNNLKIKFIFKKNFDDLIPSLIKGEGDIIAANLTVTKKRQKTIDFTNALTSVNEVLISSKGENIKNISDLKNRKIYIKKASSYYESLKKLKTENDFLQIEFVPENLSEDTILERVANGKYDLTVMDDNKFEEVELIRNDLQKNFEINKHRRIAWGIRKNSDKLKKKLNEFISYEHVDLRVERILKEDFDKILKRGYIRILTRNNSMTYFLYRGRVLGFEYELAKFFAEKYKLRTEFVIVPSRDKLIPWLLEGKGDIIAASMTTNAIKNDKISYSRKYDEVSEEIVTSLNSEIKTLQDIKGKTFYIRKESSYFKTLTENKDKYGYQIKFVPEDVETEEIIESIENGKYELTLADSSIVNREISMGSKIKKLFPLKKGLTYSWIVRKDNPLLLNAVNDFFKKNYKGLIFNIIYNKYFKNSKRINKLDRYKFKETGKISKFDEIFKKYARKYNFNWLMIASQCYQESKFNPRAKSWVGALGLMQVMPKTGKMLGFDNLFDPDQGVHAGVKYMSWLKNRFDPDIPSKDKLWFALASYNAGYGHILDARRVAKKLGLNPNKWFNNVAFAMTQLSKRKYRNLLKYGYCKCKEPIAYVSQIKTRFENYKSFIEKK